MASRNRISLGELMNRFFKYPNKVQQYMLITIVMAIISTTAYLNLMWAGSANTESAQTISLIIDALAFCTIFYYLLYRNRKLYRTQIEIIENEESYRMITENVVDMISKHTLDGRYKYISKSCKRMLGYNPEELIGTDPYDLFHPDSINLIRECHNSILEAPSSDISTYQIMRKDGTYIWFESTNKTIRNPKTNEPVEILCVSRDITSKKAEEELLNKIISFSEELLLPGSDKIEHKKILENFMYIANAKYGVMTLYNEKTGKFTTECAMGFDNNMYEIKSILGFNVIGKEWDQYSINNEQLKDKLVIKFNTLNELASRVIPEKINHAIEMLLQIGEITIVKIIADKEMIGDLTLLMPKGESFKNDYFIEIYSRQIDLYLTRLKAEEKLKTSENRLLAAQDMAHVGNWELDLHKRMMWASKEAFKIYGIEHLSDFIPLDFVQKCIAPGYRGRLDVALENLISKNLKYDEKFAIITHDKGVEKFIRSNAALITDENGTPLKVIGTVQDITEYKKAQAEIEFLSYHDQLTGLYNRRFYEEEIKRLDIIDNLPITIAMGDVNGLKLINDSFGHTMGDELLKKIADVMTNCIRNNDIVARIGGDEFVIIMPKTDYKQAESIINSIRELSSKEKVGVVDVSISIGFETKTDENQSVYEILKDTEEKMYRHKLYESSSMRSKTIDLIMNTLYQKNEREMIHSMRVSAICEAISTCMEFDKNSINQVKIAGLMHDIGKIGIQETILNKPGSLHKDEWREVEKHCEIGYRILSSVNEFSEIANFALEHHERWDGTGYPRRLSGSEISIQARIISVADSYDAMTSQRTYRETLSEEEAIEEIKKNSGTQFDPLIVKVFVEKVLSKENDQPNPQQ